MYAGLLQSVERDINMLLKLIYTINNSFFHDCQTRYIYIYIYIFRTVINCCQTALYLIIIYSIYSRDICIRDWKLSDSQSANKISTVYLLSSHMHACIAKPNDIYTCQRIYNKINRYFHLQSRISHNKLFEQPIVFCFKLPA